MRLFLFKNSCSVYLYKMIGRIRRSIGGDNLLNKVRVNKSLRDDFALSYKGYTGAAISFSMYTKEYTCTIRDPNNNGIVYALGVTFTDLVSDFISKVDIHIKETTDYEEHD